MLQGPHANHAMTAPASSMRHLFDQQRHGVLCTAHSGLGGWPFGSVTPYAVLPTGDPVVFLSEIAEHTRNLRRDGRASLFVADPQATARPQAGARISLLVRASQPATTDVAAAEACYFARFPHAAGMREAHGFHAWLLEVDCVRWIAGFGEMGWLNRVDWTGLPDPLQAYASSIVDHMNNDHASALLELVASCAGIAATGARVTTVDRGGYTAIATDHSGTEHDVRIAFPNAVDTPDGVRHATVALLHAARRARER